MEYTEAKQGRVFIIRLENNEILHKEIESFALEQKINAATLMVVGGADKGSKLIVGPEDGNASPVTPMEYVLDDVHEISGTGTIFPDEEGKPILHMHIACGRTGNTTTGCVRSGVKVWHVVEVVIYELLDTKSVRKFDKATGFKLLRT